MMSCRGSGWHVGQALLVGHTAAHVDADRLLWSTIQAELLTLLLVLTSKAATLVWVVTYRWRWLVLSAK